MRGYLRKIRHKKPEEDLPAFSLQTVSQPLGIHGISRVAVL